MKSCNYVTNDHEFSKKKKKRIPREKEKDLPDSGLEKMIASRKVTKLDDPDVLSAIQMTMLTLRESARMLDMYKTK